MDENGAVGSGFEIASIKASAALVPVSLSDTPVVLLFSWVNYTVSLMSSALVSLTYTVYHL